MKKENYFNYKITAGMLLFFGSTQHVNATIITATSCAKGAVQTAINASADGDTVKIPAGNCTWATAVTCTKGITIMGAGIDITTITDGVSMAPMLTIGANNGKNWRLTGFTFKSTMDKNWGSVVSVGGNSHAFRIDHIKSVGFGTNGGRAISCADNLWGVIDHCTFDSDGGWNQAFKILHNSWNDSGDFGDNSWTEGENYGTKKFIFLEDNTFLGSFSGVVDTYSGARIVFRYNTVKNGFLPTHGTETSGRERSARCVEIYNNSFINTDPANAWWYTAINIRGGTGVVYNNTCSGVSGYKWSVNLQNFRDDQAYAPFGKCDGTSSWDQNMAGQSGYPCIDQVGRGAGALISGYTPGPVGPLQQVASPLYAWNNTGFFTSQLNSYSSHIQLNRDYYASPKPGYVAYCYPHPLVSGINCITTGIQQITEKVYHVNVYPNPFKESTTVDLSSIRNESDGKLSFYLFNVIGKEVAVYHDINENEITIKKDFSEGVYFYKIFLNEKNIGSGKLIVQ